MRNMALMLEAWLCARKSLLGVRLFDVKMQSAEELTRPINRNSNTVSQASPGRPGQGGLNNDSDRARRRHWTGQCALDTTLGLMEASEACQQLLSTLSSLDSLFWAHDMPQLGVSLSHRIELLRGRDYVINSESIR